MNKLETLFEEAPYIGEVTEIDYQQVSVLSTDYHINQAYYLPKGAFLLVKVEGLTPSGGERLFGAIVCRISDVKYVNADKVGRKDKTRSKVSFYHLKCKVMGTFTLNKANELIFGSDAYFFSGSNSYGVYKPINSSLEQIVNFTKMGSFRNATHKLLSMNSPETADMDLYESYRVGYVRYASSVIDSSFSIYQDERNQSDLEIEKSSFEIYPSDFIRQRTGIFGMTGMGKSNTVKVLANSVIKMANHIGVKIGQLIYDVNGEYSNNLENDENNPNKNLSNANTYSIDHGMLEKHDPKYLPALNNFYLDAQYGLSIMQQGIKQSGKEGHILNNFFDIKNIEGNILTHLFWILFLYKSGCTLPTVISKIKMPDFMFQCQVDMDGKHQGFSWTFNKEMYLELSKMPILRKFLISREKINYMALNMKSIKDLMDEVDGLRTQTYNTTLAHVDQKTFTSFILQTDLNTKGSVIQGWQMVSLYSYLHCEYTAVDYKERIYQSLLNGDTVFLNLSVGKYFAKQYIAQELMYYIFERQIDQVRENSICPFMNIYIEEAQNVLGHNGNNLWIRVAHEAFKYNIGFIYATQEPSAIHPSILADTTNFIVAHLNNQKEIDILSQFEDLGDFSQLVKNAEDIGFVRMRLLSKPYTVPVQMDKY